MQNIDFDRILFFVTIKSTPNYPVLLSAFGASAMEHKFLIRNITSTSQMLCYFQNFGK